MIAWLFMAAFFAVLYMLTSDGKFTGYTLLTFALVFVCTYRAGVLVERRRATDPRSQRELDHN